MRTDSYDLMIFLKRRNSNLNFDCYSEMTPENLYSPSPGNALKEILRKIIQTKVVGLRGIVLGNHKKSENL